MSREGALEYTTVKANGLSFNVATAGEGERLALCLHGFPESSYAYRHQLPLMAKLGYRAWAPDLRGYGKSSRPSGIDAYSMDKLEADVAGLIDASGAKHVTLIGHDWGGAIAWSFASHAVRPLERLVIMNCAHPMCMRQGLRTPKQLLRSWYMFAFQIPWLPEKILGAFGAEGVRRLVRATAVDRKRFPEEVLRVYQRNALEHEALTAMLNYYRAIPRSARDPRQRDLPVIETPTLLIWGECDAALRKELTFGTDRYVRDLTLRYLPGVSHWVQQEAPETVNQMLSAWLKNKPVPQAA
jgi:pimeloyl-ACP methyl ester carboxylesterase